MFKTLLMIAIGGAFGAVSRYGLAQLAINLFGKGFPFGTLIANFVGSLLMGLLFGLIEAEHLVPEARMALGIGFLGALTTFSTFSLDTLLLMQHGDWLKALLNVFLNVGLSLTAAYIGLILVAK